MFVYLQLWLLPFVDELSLYDVLQSEGSVCVSSTLAFAICG